MVTSLGLDAATSCAAARAGLVRIRPLNSYPVVSEDNGEEIGLGCHAIPLAVDGFEGKARLLRLIELALKDVLNRNTYLDGMAKCGTYLSLADSPSVQAIGGNIRINPEYVRQISQSTAVHASVECVELALWLLDRAFKLAQWTMPPPLRFVTTCGHTGVARAINAAMQDMNNGEIDAAIIGGVDSILDADLLAGLEEAGRLKTPENPAGITPGEAAAFVVLETPKSVMTRKGQAIAELTGLGFAEEANSSLSETPPIGTGLADAFMILLSRHNRDVTNSMWLISDLNGEPWRSMDWGHALTRMVSSHPAFNRCDLWYPAASFGEIGAACGAVGLCVAMTAMQRGYALDDTVIFALASDFNDRAAMSCRKI